jgi:hypothetical protein
MHMSGCGDLLQVVIAEPAVSTPAAPPTAAGPSAAEDAPAVAAEQQQEQAQQPPGTSKAASGAALPLPGTSGAGGGSTQVSPRSVPHSTAGAGAGDGGSPSGSSSRPASSAGLIQHHASGVVLHGDELWLPVDPRPLGPWQNNPCRALYILLAVPDGEAYTVG